MPCKNKEPSVDFIDFIHSSGIARQYRSYDDDNVEVSRMVGRFRDPKSVTTKDEDEEDDSQIMDQEVLVSSQGNEFGSVQLFSFRTLLLVIIFVVVMVVLIWKYDLYKTISLRFGEITDKAMEISTGYQREVDRNRDADSCTLMMNELQATPKMHGTKLGYDLPTLDNLLSNGRTVNLHEKDESGKDVWITNHKFWNNEKKDHRQK